MNAPIVLQRGVFRLTSLVVICLGFFLASCGSMPVTRTDAPDDWAQTTTALNELKQWRLVARIAVQTETQGGSLDMYWRQQDRQFSIKLIAPMGQGAMQLKGDADWVTARLADGSELQGKPDELMQQHFDVLLPVDALSYWLRGMGMPQHELSAAAWNTEQQLHTFNQRGWRVEMQQYQQVDGYMLPHRLYLEPENSDQTSVRVIISRWQIEPA